MCGPINVKECYEKTYARKCTSLFRKGAHVKPGFIEVHMKIFRSSLDTKKRPQNLSSYN
jgi:hypothetical protein